MFSPPVCPVCIVSTGKLMVMGVNKHLFSIRHDNKYSTLPLVVNSSDVVRIMYRVKIDHAPSPQVRPCVCWAAVQRRPQEQELDPSRGWTSGRVPTTGRQGLVTGGSKESKGERLTAVQSSVARIQSVNADSSVCRLYM